MTDALTYSYHILALCLGLHILTFATGVAMYGNDDLLFTNAPGMTIEEAQIHNLLTRGSSLEEEEQLKKSTFVSQSSFGSARGPEEELFPVDLLWETMDQVCPPEDDSNG